MKARRVFLAFALLVPAPLFADEMHEPVLHFVQVDRLEYQAEPHDWLWDLQGWVGRDLHKFWWKAEGTHGETEAQLLYSRAVSPFFDLQFGLRHEFEPESRRSFATIGIQGLAPQWFEVDTALFIADNGKLSARFEAEYEMFLTQRLILQPRLEINVGASAEPEYALGAGLRSLEFGVRLRYEIQRKFAPYIGIEWHSLYGATADAAEINAAGMRGTTAVAGVRAWF